MRRSIVVLAVLGTACSQYTAKATVTVAVSGPGAVRSSALQGDCRGTCWFSVSRETPVHLEPIVDGQASFAGWSGACNGTGACDLKPDTDASVAATFLSAPPRQPRHLQVSMNGSGNVRSDPPGIDCPRTCAADFPDGTAVSLNATGASGWDFTGFGGACSGMSCAVTLSSDVSALATFLQRPVTLSVQLVGSGSVVSNPGGIDCPRICSTAFSSGTNLMLTASPEAGFAFSGFSGACNGPSCGLQLSSDTQVSAAFSAIPSFNLTVVTGGSGAGKVTSLPPGIDCPGTCSATFLQHTSVALSAAPDALSKFKGWSGSCRGASCTIALESDTAVAAEFGQRRYAAIDLGTPPDGWFTVPAGISPQGTFVAGRWGGPSQGFLWDGRMQVIGPLNSTPAAVNDSAVVVGTYGNASGWPQAYRWAAGLATDLATLGGQASGANAVNRDGVAVGWAARADATTRAVYWTAKGPTDLGSLGGAWNGCSNAHGINSDGVIVGESCVVPYGSRPVRFRDVGVIDDLGTLGGAYGLANAINDAGVIVGYSSLATGALHGFVYSDGRMIDAGSLPGLTHSQLLAINRSGIAVGNAHDGPSRGVLYAAGKMVDLNSLVDQSAFVITSANGIDEAGNIVAQGDNAGTTRALLLRPQ